MHAFAGGRVNKGSFGGVICEESMYVGGDCSHKEYDNRQLVPPCSVITTILQYARKKKDEEDSFGFSVSEFTRVHVRRQNIARATTTAFSGPRPTA